MKSNRLLRITAAAFLSLFACAHDALADPSSAPGMSLPRTVPIGTRVDFAEILHYALLDAAVRHDSVEKIRQDWAGVFDNVDVVNVNQTRNRCLIGTNDTLKIQEIAIRGTTNLRNLLYDLRYAKRWSPQLEISVHRGFELMTFALYDEILSRLKAGYSLRITGQSLGAAEALILAMRLSKEGHAVDQIVTFGQPKVTDAEGAAIYGHLPILRVVHQNDPVSLLPPADIAGGERPYVHFGREIILLNGTYYCIADDKTANAPLPAGFLQELSVPRLSTLRREHNILSYVANLQGKLARLTEVPVADREQYISPQYRF